MMSSTKFLMRFSSICSCSHYLAKATRRFLISMLLSTISGEVAEWPPPLSPDRTIIFERIRGLISRIYFFYLVSEMKRFSRRIAFLSVE